ncbi:MAG: 50S ribosomal protein L25 [Flavobacteriia bacterium]|jgi:large subunit ribosomal protein L25|nr:50S ribosomal protein L25 [Flavobacteriia bacterium]
MKTVQLSGSLRANVGKKDASSLRNAGLVPCVLYGQGQQTHFSVKQVAIEKIVYSPDVYQVELNIDGKTAVGIIQELQQHPTKDTIQHVDFLELNETKTIRIKLPVRLVGSSPGVMAGGKLMLVFRTLQCVGLPKDLPEAIILDIAKLNIGGAIRVNSINLPGITFLDPANAVVVSVKMARGAIKGEETEEDDKEAVADAPEVVEATDNNEVSEAITEVSQDETPSEEA